MVNKLVFVIFQIKMTESEPAPYDDEEEIQLMDTDGTNLQFDEQFIETKSNTIEKKSIDSSEEKAEKSPSLLIIGVCFSKKINPTEIFSEFLLEKNR